MVDKRLDDDLRSFNFAEISPPLCAMSSAPSDSEVLAQNKCVLAAIIGALLRWLPLAVLALWRTRRLASRPILFAKIPIYLWSSTEIESYRWAIAPRIDRVWQR